MINVGTATASYLNNFQPILGVPGLGEVLETRFADKFANVPRENADRAAALAAQALGELGANERAKLSAEVAREQTKAWERVQSGSLRSGGLRLAGELFKLAATPSGGGGDPVALLATMRNNLFVPEFNDRNAYLAPAAAFTAQSSQRLQRARGGA